MLDVDVDPAGGTQPFQAPLDGGLRLAGAVLQFAEGNITYSMSTEK